MRILSGVQPSGSLHLGNYLGAIRQFVAFQDHPGYECYYFVADLHALTVANVRPRLPRALHAVPHANVEFLPIEGAWFSGSMNYLGRKRRADGSPEYEATHEIKAALQISVPEFQQLVSHEVAPGHVKGWRSLRPKPDRAHPAFSREGPASQSRARPGWHPPAMGPRGGFLTSGPFCTTYALDGAPTTFGNCALNRGSQSPRRSSTRASPPSSSSLPPSST